MSRQDRAKQFMPFSTLKGYEELIGEKNKTVCEKKELTDEQIEKLNQVITLLKKGDVVKVVHYEKGGYITTVGAITQIDLTFKFICVVKSKIHFLNIYDISVEQE